MSEEDDGVRWLLGLDLGQSQDFTGLAAAKRTPVPRQTKDRPQKYHYDLMGIERFDLNTPYDVMVDYVVARTNRPPFNDPAKKPRLVLDMTGVGRPVFDMFNRAMYSGVPCPDCVGKGLDPGLFFAKVCFTCYDPVVGRSTGLLKLNAHLIPVTITGGQVAHAAPDEKGGGFSVPKKDLVGALQVLLTSGRLRIEPVPGTSLAKWAPILQREFENFRVKITAHANETYEAWREREHDDLVLAVALACWCGEKAMLDLWYRVGEPDRPEKPPPGHSSSLAFSDHDRPRWQPR